MIKLTCPDCHWDLVYRPVYMGRIGVWVCFQCYEIWG